MTRFTPIALGLALAVLPSCSAPPDASLPACTTTAQCHGGAVCIDGHCMIPRDAGAPMDARPADAHPPTEVLSVRIDPPMATLDSIDGASVMQMFTLIGVQRDGMEHPLTSASWNLDSIRVGTIDSHGLFTADGSAGGVSTVTATTMLVSGPGMATATVTVNLHRTITVTGAPADVATHFMGTGITDPTAIDVRYPLEGAMMPANVFPPTIQWNPVGAAGDFFRVTIHRPHASIVAYLVHSGAAFGHGWPVDVAAWHALANSDPDSDVAIGVDRYEASTSRLIAGAGTRTMHLARGNLFGSVYYEHRLGGNPSILRIHAQTAVRDTLIPSPPPLADGTRCIGCHALTRDGRYIFGDTTQRDAVYDLTTDLTTDPPAPRFPALTTGVNYVASFDPDGTYFVAGSHVSSGLTIFSASTGAMATATGLPTASSGYPSWSPDGMHIAYAGDVVVAPAGHPEPGDPIGGNIYVLDRTTPTGLDFAAPRRVHVGTSLSSLAEGGTNDTHPTWSPDGRFIAFQHGVGTFTHVVRNPGALYMLAEGGSVYRLDHANGSGADGYWPTFAPYVTTEQGGRSYYWMAFYTRRDYGNAILGTAGTQFRQLWVVAVDTHPTAGVDPSLVPYWLPGQDIRTSNFSAFWAPEACRASAAACTTSSECCSGRCAMDPITGMSSCVSPPMCHHEGEMCGSDGDCCAPLHCFGNVCATNGPM